MNICFLTTEYPNQNSGGVEHVTYDLANGFIENGHQVHIISIFPLKNQTEQSKLFLGIIIGNDLNKLTDTIAYIKQNNINVIIDQSHLSITQHYLGEIKKQTYAKLIKVLHTDPAAAEKGTIDNYPILSNNILNIGKAKILNTIRKAKRHQYLEKEYKRWYSLYDKIVLLSNKFIPVFTSYINTDPQNKITSIPNPLIIHGAAEKYNKEDIVLYVGRLCKQAKRPDRLIRIWEKVYRNNPTWKLIVIGDGELKQQLIDYCDKKNIQNIEFTGQTDPNPFYKKASILCLTSTYEGFGLVLTEALSNQIIPIAFNSYEAISDLISNGNNGYLIKPFDLKAYADCLTKLMQSEALQNQMRNSIAKTFDNNKYEINTITNQWNILFNEIIRGANF